MWAGWSICAFNETIEVVTTEEGFHKATSCHKIAFVELGDGLGKLEKGAMGMGCWVIIICWVVGVVWWVSMVFRVIGFVCWVFIAFGGS